MQISLETAKLHWRNANTPVSDQFGDVYFSADDGFAESQYVYILNNHLIERFNQLEATHFNIAETGFGTGLNFLLTWQCWQQHAPENKKLYYISTECFPLTKDDLEQSLNAWPALGEYSLKLIANYPLALSGLHCIELSDGVTLILLLGDAKESLELFIENKHPSLNYAHHRAVDAWFLDGFSPDKNPSMWTPELFNTIAKLSKRSTTFASFTAAGIVRRGLQHAGFNVEKVKGFGKKREMIRGCYTGLPTAIEHTKESTRERPYEHFWPVYRQQKRISSVIIIGAGIAGISTALLLAEAGIEVTLVDKHSEPLQGASGNPQAMLFPKLSHKRGSFAEFNLHSYLYAQRFYAQYFNDAFYPCGMLQMIDDEEQAHKVIERFARLEQLVSLLNAEDSSKISNTKIKSPCFWYSQSGWINPAILRQKILNNKHIHFIGNTEIQTIEKTGLNWLVYTNCNTTLNANSIVLCNANAANLLVPELQLPTKDIRGQISIIAAKNTPALNTIVCHEGYIAPSDPNNFEFFTCGSSYDLKSTESNLLQISQDENINTLKKNLSDFQHIEEKDTPLQGRVEFRCSANDYLPIVGAIPDKKAFIHHYKMYAKNSKAHIPILGTYKEGLFINIAHGSRGFSTAPISAALIRSYVLDQPYPMPFNMMTALNAARFLIKDIARKKYAQENS
jgi:tRNA 5-methylaminomethyl-2-thiouridine biosynthesis bifunctional protein